VAAGLGAARAPEHAAPPPETGSLAAIRERLASNQGASATLRDVLVEFHGETEGGRLYDAALEERAHTAKLSELKAELAEVRAVYSTLIEESAQNLISLQENMDLTYVIWREACGALESQRIFNEQLKSQLREQTRAIIGKMKRPGPAPVELVKQWQTPSWHQPNQPQDDRRFVDVVREPQ